MFSTIQELAADIAKELREHPERWTTGAAARDADGYFVPCDDEKAVCWCLYGHIVKRVPRYDGEVHLKPFLDVAGADWETQGFADINDNSTVEKIAELCDKVAGLNS